MGAFGRNRKGSPSYQLKAEERKTEKAKRQAEKRDAKREAKRGKNKTMEIKYLVAVYDSLRKLGKYHINLDKETTYIGSFDSEPIYNLYSFENDKFAGIKEHGNTSITMEVYEVTEKKLDDIDDIQHYDASAKDQDNLFLRKTINSPYGEVEVYIYNNITEKNEPIQYGDWIDYLNTKRFIDGNKDLQAKLDKVEKEIENEKQIQLALSTDIEDDDENIPTASYKDIMNGNFSKNIMNTNAGFGGNSIFRDNHDGDAWNNTDNFGCCVD